MYYYNCLSFPHFKRDSVHFQVKTKFNSLLIVTDLYITQYICQITWYKILKIAVTIYITCDNIKFISIYLSEGIALYFGASKACWRGSNPHA